MDILERFDIVSGFVPVNLAAANNTGDYISLKNVSRVACVCFKDAGTAGDDITLAVQQATAVDGTGAKALAISRIWSKEGTQTTTGTWTLNTQTAANTWTNTTNAELEGIFAIVVDADELDVDNGFDCIRMYVGDVGANAQLGTGFYLLESQTPQATLPSPIVD